VTTPTVLTIVIIIGRTRPSRETVRANFRLAVLVDVTLASTNFAAGLKLILAIVAGYVIIKFLTHALIVAEHISSRRLPVKSKRHLHQVWRIRTKLRRLIAPTSRTLLVSNIKRAYIQAPFTRRRNFVLRLLVDVPRFFRNVRLAIFQHDRARTGVIHYFILSAKEAAIFTFASHIINLS